MAIETPSPDGAPPRRTGCAAPLTALAAALALGAASFLAQPARGPEGGAPKVSESLVPSAAAAQAIAEAIATQAGPVETARAEEPAPGDALAGPLSRWAWSGTDPAAGAPAPEVAPEAPRITVPLPVPRPPEFRAPAQRTERLALRRQQAAPPPPPPREDDRSFLEKLFGVERPPGLAYAALESRPADVLPRRTAPERMSPPLGPTVSPSAGTAVYNILARTVTLPSGERLEAHSGLGEGFDNPRSVHVRMRGATPPGTYDLTEREQLFHGVRAIRMTPVGGAEAIYGRNGILAHTYMLGPKGESNGCVSFRDYDRFLQAYLRGEIQRLVVVTGGQDAPPALAGTLRVARAGD